MSPDLEILSRLNGLIALVFMTNLLLGVLIGMLIAHLKKKDK